MASSEKIIAENEELLNLIPQRPPMVMIHQLVSVEGNRTVTRLTVKEDNIFFLDGHLREPGIIENIAQTAAAGAGYRMAQAKPEGTPPVGFIGAVKNLVIHRLPEAGEILETEVSVEHEVFDAAIVFGKIKSNSNFVAECEMKIFTKSSN